MNDILYMVLRLVLVAAITVLVRYAVPLIKKEIKTNTTLEGAQFLIDISNAVADAVSTTSQVFVDDLKAEGAFGDLEKSEAASRALEICL